MHVKVLQGNFTPARSWVIHVTSSLVPVDSVVWRLENFCPGVTPEPRVADICLVKF